MNIYHQPGSYEHHIAFISDTKVRLIMSLCTVCKIIATRDPYEDNIEFMCPTSIASDNLYIVHYVDCNGIHT